jgi:hypothetical protein
MVVLFAKLLKGYFLVQNENLEQITSIYCLQNFPNKKLLNHALI